MDIRSARQFYESAKQNGTLNRDNILRKTKVKPVVPEPFVPDC